jgi:hypothetical protein
LREWRRGQSRFVRHLRDAMNAAGHGPPWPPC